MYTDYTDYTENNNDESYYVENNDNQNKEKLKKIGFIVLVFVVLVIVIVLVVKGCSNNENDDPTAVNENRTPTIAINWQSITLEVGESSQLVADVLSASIDNPIVSWHSDDSGIAAVNDDGYVTALSEGETNIVAIYRQNGIPYTTSCNVVVTSTKVEIESIDIVQEDISLRKGGSVLLQIAVTPEDAMVDSLTFTSDDTNIATVSDEGRINAINVGTTTITVKTSDNQFSDSVTIKVTESGTTVVNPVSLQLIGLENGVSVGTSSRVAYIISPSNATTSLTWSSSDPSIATVNNEGVVKGVKAGTCTIMASTSNNISSSLQITVSSNVVAVSRITINGDTSINMQTGWTKLLDYTISPSNATNKNVTFTSSNSSVVFVDSNGIIAALGSGTAVVTITTEDGKKTAAVNVTVTGESGSVSGSQTGSSFGGSNGSTGGSTGGSSSGGNSGGSSSGSSSSSSSSSENSCTAYNMITISHNGSNSGAIVSTISFSNTKPFTNSSLTPTLTVTDLSDCVDSVNYYVYYGTTSSNISGIASSNGTIRNSGTTIKLNQGNGYYKILVKGYDSSKKQYLNKYYYAHVNTGTSSSTSPTITKFEVTRNGSLLRLNISTTKGSADLDTIDYCLISTSTAVSCSDYRTIKKLYGAGSFSGTLTETAYRSTYYGVCIRVVGENGRYRQSCVKNKNFFDIT